MNRIVKILCVMLIPLLAGCAFNHAAPESPARTSRQINPIDGGKTNDQLRAQNHTMAQELKATEDELARLQKISHDIPPTDRLWARIRFKSGHTSVEPKIRKALTAIAGKFLAKPGKMHLEIKGYSDDEPIGGFKHSHKSRHSYKTLVAVSQARANAVAAVMIAAGIPARLVHATGLGATGFVGNNSTAEGRSMNRRVDIHLVSNSNE